jgi:hypothetical protein
VVEAALAVAADGRPGHRGAASIYTCLAMATPDALVVGDYYKQGKAINQDLRRDIVAAHWACRWRSATTPPPAC